MIPVPLVPRYHGTYALVLLYTPLLLKHPAKFIYVWKSMVTRLCPRMSSYVPHSQLECFALWFNIFLSSSFHALHSLFNTHTHSLSLFLSLSFSLNKQTIFYYYYSFLSLQNSWRRTNFFSRSQSLRLSLTRSLVLHPPISLSFSFSHLLLVVCNVRRKPVQAFVQAFARSRARRLNEPVSLSQRV